MAPPVISEPVVDRPLVDRFGRRHDSLRISITDRCNIRCFYCMPETDAQFMPKGWLLTYEEIERLTRLLVSRCGVRDVRVTGGEPLVRKDCCDLVNMLSQVPGVEDLSLTTNGILLEQCAVPLRAAGLERLNISLDTLDEARFKQITRRDGVDKVIAGIDAAIAAGFKTIKLNALAIRGISEQELVSLVRFASQRDVIVRFIEFMPLDADRAWQLNDVLSGNECLRILGDAFGEIAPVHRETVSQPAESFELEVDGKRNRIGVIRSVTRPFCGDCNRMRLTADGSLRNCLFSKRETPLRDPLRAGATDDELLRLVEGCIAEKRAGHGIDDAGFIPPERTMHSIGG